MDRYLQLKTGVSIGQLMSFQMTVRETCSPPTLPLFFTETFSPALAMKKYIAQSAGAIEYTDCFSAEG